MELLMYGLCGKMKKAVMICCYRNVVKIKMHFQDAMIFLLQDIYQQVRITFILHLIDATKDAYAGCYVISSAGHITAGQEYLEWAVWEMEEELGIKAKPEQLHFMGLHEGCCEETFYGKPFKNHEISHVYLYQEPVNIEDLTLQKEEVQEVCWLDFKECCQKVKDGDRKYCLFPEELLMIKKYLQVYLK